MPILDIQRRITEVGRLRMGHQVAYQKDGETRHRAAKLDHWRLTSRDKPRLDAAAELYGGTVVPWPERDGEFELFTETAELAILLLPGQTLSQWHESWSAGGAQRRCDGVREILTDSPCVCDTEPGERACKPTTRLSVMLPDVPGLGCWRLESHGYYAAAELSATAAMLEQATVLGELLPARLRIDQRRKVKAGKTTLYAVPVIDIDTTPRHALTMSQPRPLASAGKPALPPAGPMPDQPALQAGDKPDFGERVPLPDEPAPVSPLVADRSVLTDAQAKKLNVLVGKLRPEHITTEQLWRAGGLDPENGRGEDGELHWSPLRDSLSRDQAHALIDRLSALEEKVAPGFQIPESVANRAAG